MQLRVVTDDDRILYDFQTKQADWKLFNASFARYITATAHKIGRAMEVDAADLEDVTQTTYLLLLEPRRPRYRPVEAAAKTYLYYLVQSAFHVVLDRGRRRQMREGSEAEDPHEDAIVPLNTAPRPSHERVEEIEWVEFLVDDLSDEEQFLLEEVANDRTLQDLADEQGVSRSTLSRRVTNLRRRLTAKATVAMRV